MSEELRDMIADDDTRMAMELEDDVVRLYHLRQQKGDLDNDIAAIDPSSTDYGRMGRLRRWLLEHEGEKVIAAEYGLEAWLASRGEEQAYEASEVIQKKDPHLYNRLLELNILQIDHDRLRDAIKKGRLLPQDLAPYSHPIERTKALRTGLRNEK